MNIAMYIRLDDKVYEIIPRTDNYFDCNSCDLWNSGDCRKFEEVHHGFCEIISSRIYANRGIIIKEVHL